MSQSNPQQPNKLEIVPSNAQTIFYDLLTRVGASGRYQTFCLVFWCLIYIVASSTCFMNPFLFNQEPYYVAGLDQKATEHYVCSLEASQRSQYSPKYIPSFIDRFGDFRCEGKGEITDIQAFIYLGGIVGSVCATLINSLIRKKLLIMICVVLEITGIMVSMYTNDLYVAAVGLFLNFCARSITIELVICFLTETVEEELRSKQSIILLVFYSLGITLNGAVFYILSWRMVMYFYILAPLIIGFIGLYFYIQETPFDLITNFTPQESLSALSRIARINSKQNHGITLAELANIKNLYEISMQQKKQDLISLFDLFRFDSLRKKAICCILIHFFIYYEFSAPMMAVNQFSASIYLNGIFLGFSEICASSVCYFIIDYWQRKKLLYLSSAIAFVVSVPIFILTNCKESCTESEKWLQTCGLFIFRMMVSTTYNAFYIQQNEVFPTQIRSIAALLSGLASQFGPVFLPMISNATEDSHVSIITTFAVACLLVILTTTQLPETFKVQPPQMIEQLNFEKKPAIDQN